MGGLGSAGAGGSGIGAAVALASALPDAGARAVAEADVVALEAGVCSGAVPASEQAINMPKTGHQPRNIDAALTPATRGR